MHRMPERSRGSKRVPAYDRYAEVYDLIGQRSFGERIAEATLSYLLEHDLHPRSAVDLACGTGAATLVFAAAGIAVTGIDMSESMLAQARRAANDAGLHVEFRAFDMRELRLAEQVELVTCFYDAMNYLLVPEDLERVFASVLQTLTPGGLFVFDLNTSAKFASSWNESCTVATDREDLFGVYQSWYEHETGLSPLVMTFFMRTSDGAWDRFDEEHVERAYVLSDVRELLKNTGFELLEMLDYGDRSPRFGGSGSERSHRVVFIARLLAATGSGAEKLP